jgi:hypothetical protein
MNLCCQHINKLGIYTTIYGDALPSHGIDPSNMERNTSAIFLLLFLFFNTIPWSPFYSLSRDSSHKRVDNIIKP